MIAHPWDLETPEQRRERIFAAADELEWELERKSVEQFNISLEETVPAGVSADEAVTGVWRRG